MKLPVSRKIGNWCFDAGAEEIVKDEEELIIYTKFTEFGSMLKFLESKNLVSKSAELQYIATTTKELSEAETDEVMECITALEEDEDVQNVYHNLAWFNESSAGFLPFCF